MSTDVVTTDIVIVLGLISVVVGAMSNTFYYDRYFAPNPRQAPVWVGRTTFIGLGTLLLVGGFAHLFFNFPKFR